MKLKNKADTLHANRTVTADITGKLTSLARPAIKLRTRATLVHAGDRPTDLHLLKSGWLFRYQLLADGRRQIFCFFTPGELVTPNLIFSPVCHSSIGALTTAEVLPIDRALLIDAMERDAPFKDMLFSLLAVRTRFMDERMIELGRLTALERMCVLIARLAAKVMAPSDDRFEVPLTRELVSDALGLTPVHVSRTLKVLEQDGAVRWWRTVLEIVDLQKIYANVPRNFAVHGGEQPAALI